MKKTCQLLFFTSGQPLLWRSVTINGDQELGEEINEQIKEVDGDGIVNFTVNVQNCPLDWIPIFYLLPVWPGCTAVSLEGDIIRNEY